MSEMSETHLKQEILLTMRANACGRKKLEKVVIYLLEISEQESACFLARHLKKNFYFGHETREND